MIGKVHLSLSLSFHRQTDRNTKNTHTLLFSISQGSRQIQRETDVSLIKKLFRILRELRLRTRRSQGKNVLAALLRKLNLLRLPVLPDPLSLSLLSLYLFNNIVLTSQNQSLSCIFKYIYIYTNIFIYIHIYSLQMNPPALPD